ncbi:hypothetical protein [Actinomadura madurae]|uniref:hypothetical protein n=1 Tax=Actinomadura madurae TaxID=1993 RepID=UPI0020D223B5|nr:hypothetical protein [Actinomadura madurae]MCP9950391.1 hypothetical protein [Actinomadura madurae]MCQ0008834.1 hypothetical protein [Actinomadura madurae]MCQ0015849.1 hypothetical protein [Actinomadura madurae]
MSTTRKLRVATVITRFNGGAGQVALNGALALPDGDYERAIVTGGVGMDSTASSTGNGVLFGDEAVANAAAGDLTPGRTRPGWRSSRWGRWCRRSRRAMTWPRCAR